MTNNIILKNAKLQLSDFHRWRSVADINYEQIRADDCWLLDLVTIPDRSEWGHLLTWWQHLAPYEVNEIIKGVNAISNARQRAIIAMTYLLPERIDGKEQMKRLNIKTSTYHKSKKEALLAFAKHYRQGTLETLTD